MLDDGLGKWGSYVCGPTNLSCPSSSHVPISLEAAVPEKLAFLLTTRAGHKKKIKSISVT